MMVGGFIIALKSWGLKERTGLRYEWHKFSGEVEINEAERLPLGTISNRRKKYMTSNVKGLGISGAIEYRFGEGNRNSGKT